MLAVSSRAVLWDGLGLQNPYSGIAQHAAQLSQHLRLVGICPLVLSAGRSSLKDLPHLFSKSNIDPSRSFSKVGWRVNEALYRSILNDTPGQFVFHGLANFNIPRFKSSNVKRILTIHDLIPLLSKGCVSWSSMRQFRILLHEALSHTDSIICVSEWTKRTLSDFYPFVEEKINVIPNGLPSVKKIRLHTKQKDPATRLRALSVMRYEPYKRFDRLITILDKCQDKLIVNLISDGKGKQWCRENAPHLISSGNLIVETNLNAIQLNQRFADSDFLLHTSDYEGFCLPVAEALVRGRTIVFQKGSGIEEVAGPCGWKLDANANIDEWIDVINGLKSGLIPDEYRFHKFLKDRPTWTDIAAMTGKLYND